MTDFLTQLEQAIAERLKPLKDYGLDVVNSPYRCGGSGARAIALFYFTDESAETGNSCNQNSTLTLEVKLQACDQRSHHVIYPFIEAVKISLKGFSPEVGKTGKIQYVSTRYLPYQYKNDILWAYDLTFSLRNMDCKIGDLPEAIAGLFL